MTRIALTLALGLAVFATTRPLRAKGRQVAVLRDAKVHSGPGVDFFVVERVGRGEAFDLLEERAGWVKVQLEDDAEGWLPKERVEISGVAGEEELEGAGDGEVEATVVAARADLHAGPRGTSVVVKGAPKGARMEVVGRDSSGEWLKVRWDGPPAWVRRDLVQLTAPASTLPTVAARGDSRGGAPDDLTPADDPWSDGFGSVRPGPVKALAVGLTAKGGVGWSLLSHQLKTDAGDDYAYSVQAFTFDGEATYWATAALGGRVRLHLDWAPKRLKVDRKDFKIDGKDAPPAEPVALSVKSVAIDAVALARLQVVKADAWIEGRLGWRRWSLDQDVILTGYPGQENPKPHPAFHPTTFNGPVLGAGVHLPVTAWGGVDGGVDLIPFAFVDDPFGEEDFDTRSGDVDQSYGLAARGGFWLTPHASPDYTIDVDVRFHWERFFTRYTAGADDPAPRAGHGFLDAYTSADSEEGVFGAVVAVVLHH